MLVRIALALMTGAGVALASPIVYTASLSGPNENPVNASPGTGLATISFDPTAHTLRVQVSFSGLTGTTTASHIHCCITTPGGTAGVATITPTFTGFPLGVTSGTYDLTYDTTLASAWNPSYVTASGGTNALAETALGVGLNAGTAYLNIHSSTFGGGEIRGFLVAVPEPSTWALTAGALALGGLRRRRR